MTHGNEVAREGVPELHPEVFRDSFSEEQDEEVAEHELRHEVCASRSPWTSSTMGCEFLDVHDTERSWGRSGGMKFSVPLHVLRSVPSHAT